MQMVQHHTAEIDQLRQRRISIVWFGIAQEVRLMGSFDNWTQGFSLSPEAFSDGTFTKFEGILWLVPVGQQLLTAFDHWHKPMWHLPSGCTQRCCDSVPTPHVDAKKKIVLVSDQRATVT